MNSVDNTPKLNPDQIKIIQSIVRIILYYIRIIDSSIVVAVNDFLQQKNTAT